MSKTSLSQTISLLGAAALSVGLLLHAQAAQAEDHPCKNDVQKFCKAELANKGGGRWRFAPCLKQHENELSAACRAHTDAVKAKVDEAREACHADAVKLCKGEKPGEGRILMCLGQHTSELSAPCKAALDKAKEN
jgi:hypothetical protein